MHLASWKGPLFYKKTTPHFPLFTTPPFHFLPTGLRAYLSASVRCRIFVKQLRHAVYVEYLYIIVKLINLLFSVCFATGYIHSGEIKVFINDYAYFTNK